MNNPKSATVAGLLGIFLGAFGAHNWYLGEKAKGIAHVCMMSAGVLVSLVASFVLPNVLSISAFITAAWLLSIFSGLASPAMSASGIWGFIEGIIILTQGDAGLARKGYVVASPLNAQNTAPAAPAPATSQPTANNPTAPVANPAPTTTQPSPVTTTTPPAADITQSSATQSTSSTEANDGQ